jgi:hypothetical protein
MTTRGNTKGGPNTPAGKKKVSQNALKHGLTSMLPVDRSEQVLVDQFIQELKDYYQPQNPLALLQIERIAICRAKLKKLYAVERVRLQLARQEIVRNPSKIVEKLVGISGVPRGMVKEMVRYGELVLPCNLTPNVLSEICHEIQAFYGQIEKDDDLVEHFPALIKFLEDYPIRGLSENASYLEKSLAVMKRIEQVIKSGDQYGEAYRPIIETIVEMLQPKASPYILEEEERGLTELEQYLAQSQASQKRNKPQNAEVLNESESPPLDQNSTVNLSPKGTMSIAKKMRVFLDLWHFYELAIDALPQFHELRSLLIESVTLPTQEADLMLRYQTTLERRLSSAMGELLALEKQGNL